MLRIGKLADYALLITNQLVSARAELWTTDDLADATHLPTATVRKLLKKLVDAGILVSYRGINGGYSLAKDPKSLSVADVIVAIEGPISLTQCATQHGECELLPNCELKGNWNFLNEVVAELFQQISLSDMSLKMSKHKPSLQSAMLSAITEA